MSKVTPTSDTEHELVSDVIENFLPDDTNKTLSSEELIVHFIGKLGPLAEKNPIVLELSLNSEKSFNKDDMKAMAGKNGFEAYKKDYEASMAEEKSPAPEKSPASLKMSSAETPPSNGKESKTDKMSEIDQKIAKLSPEEKVVFKNLKEDWLKNNKKLVSGMSEKEADQLASEINYEALMNAKNNYQPEQASGQMPRGGQMSSEEVALFKVAGAAFKIASKLTSNLAGGLMGVGHGALKGSVDALKNIGGGSEVKDVTQSPNYESSIVENSKENLSNALVELDNNVKALKDKREKGNWSELGQEEDTKKLLKNIDRSLTDVNDLKNVLGNDVKRKGVDEETKLDGIKSLESVKDSMRKLDNNLEDTPSDNELKERAKSISKAIDRLVKAIKNLFSKDKEVTKENDEEVTLGM